MTMTSDSGVATRPGEQWDVFISYAREDYVQAKAVQEALLKCVTGDGAAPRIYLDISRHGGTPAGVDWQSYLEEALRRSRYVVAFYSQIYFEKPVCVWELHEAYRLNLKSGVGLIPLLIDPGAAKKVPYAVHGINWIPTTRPDWFGELREAAGLREPTTRRILGFGGPPAGAVAGRTLEPVRVEVSLPDGSPEPGAQSEVTISAEPAGAGLTGTLTVRAERGTAVFSDLVLHAPADAARLLAAAPGCEQAVSEPFPVRALEVRPPEEGTDRGVLPAHGRPVFFPDGQALAVFDEQTLTVYSARYEAVGSAKFRARPRLWARGRSLLAVADWSGRVLLAGPDGAIRAWDVPTREGARFSVPGALAFDGDTLYVGTWAGEVWSVPLGDGDPALVLEHPPGIQVLAVDGGRLVVGGLDGTARQFTGGRAGTEHRLEPLLLGAAPVRDFGLIVGEQQVYRLDLAKDQLLRVKQPVGRVTGVLPGAELTAIVDDEGGFVCFDAELAVSVGFRTVPGARPVDSGLGGRLLVLEYPDGSHALVREGRVTYVCGHPLAVCPDGERAAVSDGGRVMVLPIGELTDGQDEPGQPGDRDRSAR